MPNPPALLTAAVRRAPETTSIGASSIGCMMPKRAVNDVSIDISIPQIWTAGGITRAADELNTVQSNITHRVKALEAEIGAPLFERHSRGMTLTGAGRRLLPYAQRMAALSHEAVLAARDDGEPKGPLAIGSMETTAAVRLPSLLAEFHRRF